MKSDADIIAGLVGILIGFLVMGFVSSALESESCKALEKKIGINLAYTWGGGCVRAEDL